MQTASRTTLRDLRPRLGAREGSLFTAIYVALAAVSLSTNYVASNTAALWMPTGFSIGLLMCRGLRLWPIVLGGAFIVNLGTNLALPPTESFARDLLAAIAVSAGNTLEAVWGAWLAVQFCQGPAFLDTSRGVVTFMCLVATSAPIASALAGGASSLFAGLTNARHIIDVMWTWYVANMVGTMIFAAPTVLVLTKGRRLRPRLRLESAVLALLIIFVGQATCGIFITSFMEDLPRTYMLVPLLFWASIRFGTVGAVLTILTVTLIALIGTLRGYNAFPAITPAGSLLQLQIFLSLLSTLNLYAAASRREVLKLQADLREKLSTRTYEVEKLIDDRELSYGLLVHDIKGPITSIRMVLKVLRANLLHASATPADLSEALKELEGASGDLLEHVQATLADMEQKVSGSARVQDVVDLVSRRLDHREGGARAGQVRFTRHFEGLVDHANLVALIVSALLENGLKHGASEQGVDVTIDRSDDVLTFKVRDYGVGITPDRVDLLFRQPAAPDITRHSSGMGLLLSARLALGLGGSIIYEPAPGGGASFVFRMPCQSSDTWAAARNAERPPLVPSPFKHAPDL